MSKQLTNRDQLNRLKEPWRSQAFENCKSDASNGVWLDMSSGEFKTTLRLSFSWVYTSQGYCYWKDIFDNPQNYLQDENNN